MILGIDGGASGGMAILQSDGTPLLIQPLEPQVLLDTIRKYTGVKAYLEHLVKFVGVNRTGASGCVYGYSVGISTGILMASNVPRVEVMPAVWMRVLNCGRRVEYDSHYKWKAHLRDMARYFYSDWKKQITLETCDALLIARFGWLQEQNK